jgi:hypothetical protein
MKFYFSPSFLDISSFRKYKSYIIVTLTNDYNNKKDLKPVLKLNYTTDTENLNVTLNWTVKAPLGSRFKPEKMILLYSENNSTYKFVNKYRK